MSSFEQRSTVLRLHNFPRFGNPNDISSLASLDQDWKDDYIRGVVAMTLILSFLIIVWASTLLFLKVRYTPDQMGCAVKGQVIDVNEMRKARVPRNQRKSRISRAWRVQTVFLLASLLIPFFSFLLMNKGYEPVMSSLLHLNELSNDASVRASTGISIANHVRRDYKELRPAQIKVDICDDLLDRAEQLAGINLDQAQQQVQQGADSIENFLDQDMRELTDGLHQFVNATAQVEFKIEQAFALDWIIKTLLVSLNIINLTLIFGVSLTKNNHNAIIVQTVNEYLSIPLFCVLLLGTTFGFGIALTGAIANADFCAGGPAPGSPHGTFQDVLRVRGSLTDSLAFQSLEFFGNGCVGDNPLQFIPSAQIDPDRALIFVENSITGIENLDTSEYSSECKADLQEVKLVLVGLGNLLSNLINRLQVVSRLVSCSSISPIFESFYNGPACADSINGQLWLFSSLLGITISGLIMLSTRAALYNPVRRGKLKKRREKEFEDYKKFMSDYYDVSKWDIECSKEAKMVLKQTGTFETENSDESNVGEESVAQPSPARSALPSIADFRRRQRAESDSDDSLYSYNSSDYEDESFEDQASFFSTSMSTLVERFRGLRGKSKNDDSSSVGVQRNSEPQSMLEPDPDASAVGSEADDDDSSFFGVSMSILFDKFRGARGKKKDTSSRPPAESTSYTEPASMLGADPEEENSLNLEESDSYLDDSMLSMYVIDSNLIADSSFETSSSLNMTSGSNCSRQSLSRVGYARQSSAKAPQPPPKAPKKSHLSVRRTAGSNQINV